MDYAKTPVGTASPSKRADYYRGVVEDVRRYMLAHHSFKHRVEELVAALK